MIPRREIVTLLLTVTDAMRLAEAGDAAGGYEVLLAGIHRVRTLFQAEAWGVALVTRWQDAVERYTEEYPVGRA